MLFKPTLALAGLVSAVSAFNASEVSLEARVDPHCAGVKGVHVIAIGGQGTTNGNSGLLEPLAKSLRSHVGQHSTLIQIGYPEGYMGSQAIEYAIPKVRHHIKDYAHRCPKTKMVLASYSLGAATMMDVLCGSAQTGAGALPSKYYKHVLANVVYGDLTFVPHRPYDKGTCTKKTGIVPRQHPKKCAPFSKKTHSWCDHGDENCCSGHKYNVHFEYPQKYDAIALKYVQRRFHFDRTHHGNKHHHHSRDVEDGLFDDALFVDEE